MPEWLDGILGTVTDLADTAGSTMVGVYGAQAQAQVQAQQRAYLAQMSSTSQQLDASQTKTFMVYGVGLLLFLLALRQTSQAR